MAKIQFGSIVNGMSGKLSGDVYSHNGSTSYVRKKGKVTNPKTSSQTSVRNRFTGLSQGWKGITANQRAAWNASTANFTKKGAFGVTKVPSGAQLYQKLNNNLLNIGGSAISDVPQPASVAAFSSLAVTATAGTPTLSATFSPAIPASVKVLVFATAPQSAGKSYIKNLFRQIGILASTDTSPKNLLSLYTAKFGSVGVAGQQIFIKLVPVATASGQQGAVIQASCIIILN
jgi:hypothetical protein